MSDRLSQQKDGKAYAENLKIVEELTASGKSPHFVQPVKEAVQE